MMDRHWPAVLTGQQNDATVQKDIESSNQVSEYVNPH